MFRHCLNTSFYASSNHSNRNLCIRIGGIGLSTVDQVCLLHQKKYDLPSSINQYGHLLKIATNSDQLNQIHAQMIVHGFHQNDFLTAKLITHLMATGGLDLATLVFNWVQCPNEFLCASMIRAYSCFGAFKEAIVLYTRMRYEYIRPNNFSFPFALKSCATLKALYEGEQIHSDIVKLGFVSDVFVQTALLDMYVKCSRIKTAKQVFDTMRVKNVVSWTAIVAGYCKCGHLEEARKLFNVMPDRNVITWNVMIDGLARFSDMETAQWYFDTMPQKNMVSWTIMIGGYSRAGKVEKARFLFDQMVDREVVVWTAMISCYVQNGIPGEAIKLFREMIMADIKTDAVTMLAIVSAAAQLGSLDLCEWIENCITDRGFGSDIRVLNSIINMYVQCGSIEKACSVFDKMPRRDVISYNSMIAGFATHGDANQALSLFSRMTQDKIPPNNITFIGILTACAHGGLVEEGRRYFRMMIDLGYIEPLSEHYSCMVDILSRAGYLDEAHNLLLDMPLKPFASAWGALLGACRTHGNLGLAEVVAKRLFQMEPDNPGSFAILANMYTEKGMWEASASVRRLMKENKVFKTPGSSWAEVHDVVGNDSRLEY